MLFFVMLLAHLLADYPLQPDWLVARKSQWPWLLVHGLVVFATLLLLLPFLPTVWPLLMLISVVHIIQDWFKLRVSSDLYGAPLIPYLIDQSCHLLILGVCASLPTMRLLTPPLPQTIYLLGSVLVLIGWTLPITRRVARIHVELQAQNKSDSKK